MKRTILSIFVFMLCMFSIPAYADNISVSIEGRNVVFNDVSPTIINGRTMVPLRDVSNALGASVDWNNNTKQITITKDNTKVLMTLNSTILKTNNYIRKMDTYPTILNSHTMIPARYIAESFGYTADWNNHTRVVSLNKANFVKVHFVDVGQGDCAIVNDNGHSMVIDAGEEGNENTVTNYIKSLGISNIDYVVATHPHSDHIGSLDAVINNFKVSNIIMPNVVNSSHSFENLISAIENSNANVLETKAGSNYNLGNSQFSVLGPIKYDNDELNNDSAVIKLTYGSDSIIFTGDAESDEESDILSSGADISAHVLKVGHHGSSSSTSQSFINAVNPLVSVICVGSDNKYGHPTNKTLNKLGNTEIYRTDINSNIIVTLTGKGVYVETAKIVESPVSTTVNHSSKTTTTPASNNLSQGSYILNTNSKKVHLPNCSAVEKISDKNKQSYTGSIPSLTSQGYTACKICNPF